MIPTDDVLQLLGEMSSGLHRDHSLEELSARSGWSAAYLHGAFKRLAGETPKAYVQRLRLERAAAALAATEASVLEIALATGFNSHEVFTRAFGRHFGCSPSDYRARALAGVPVAERGRHMEVVRATGPCVRLYQLSTEEKARTLTTNTPTVERKELPEQPVLYIRRRVRRTDLQPTFAECFGTLFGHGVQAGLAIAGQPTARYVSVGPGLWTVDCVMPLLAPAPPEGEMQAGTLPGGPAAVAVHMGSYDDLHVTNAAVEEWIEERGLRPAGPPWEIYVTDPGETPDPAQWKTEVVWPLAE